MPPTSQELSLLINPLVPESVTHNNRILANLHSLIAFLLGTAAGILGLQSAYGFTFYLLGTIFVSFLANALLVKDNTPRTSGKSTNKGVSGVGAYFPGDGELVPASGGGYVRKGAWKDLWFSGLIATEAISGFVLGWAGVGGILR
ncbi:hypothetical protein H109_01673 [Trichophyton interdigitale MR816]|uniref:ER membrane protein complex subunit 6 n=1 Tax=Trichophyton interdigitale (strain MR816) TaxID=1215338 RepID=A0A059JFR6_TRIIM|nr:hypothetical protein H101_06090 [Trichophyton interdigitale H6]KDB26533.1 hypothetical protein H109_01673 [Trichophyton interdigitale MR816]